jgi:hypothetical protein
MEMISALHRRLVLRYHAFWDWFDYSGGPWLFAAVLLAMAIGVLVWLPGAIVPLIVLAALAIAVLLALLVPLWIATLAVWEGLFEWVGDRYRAAIERRKAPVKGNVLWREHRSHGRWRGGRAA